MTVIEIEEVDVVNVEVILRLQPTRTLVAVPDVVVYTEAAFRHKSPDSSALE
jgi:hypothetical protein